MKKITNTLLFTFFATTAITPAQTHAFNFDWNKTEHKLMAAGGGFIGVAAFIGFCSWVKSLFTKTDAQVLESAVADYNRYQQEFGKAFKFLTQHFHIKGKSYLNITNVITNLNEDQVAALVPHLAQLSNSQSVLYTLEKHTKELSKRAYKLNAKNKDPQMQRAMKEVESKLHDLIAQVAVINKANEAYAGYIALCHTVQRLQKEFRAELCLIQQDLDRYQLNQELTSAIMLKKVDRGWSYPHLKFVDLATSESQYLSRLIRDTGNRYPSITQTARYIENSLEKLRKIVVAHDAYHTETMEKKRQEAIEEQQRIERMKLQEMQRQNQIEQQKLHAMRQQADAQQRQNIVEQQRIQAERERAILEHNSRIEQEKNRIAQQKLDQEKERARLEREHIEQEKARQRELERQNQLLEQQNYSHQAQMYNPAPSAPPMEDDEPQSNLYPNLSEYQNPYYLAPSAPPMDMD